MKKLFLLTLFLGAYLMNYAQFTFKNGGGTVDVYANGNLKTSFQKAGLTITYAGDIITLRQDTKRAFTYNLDEIDTPAYSTMDSVVSTISGWLSTYGAYWSGSGNYIYQTTLTDSVGIGTATPSSLFEVNGRSKINAIKSDTIYSNIDLQDSTDITDAVNSYLANNDVLRLPQGLFYISDTIKVRSNMRIIGAGKNKTILKTTTEGVVYFRSDTADYFELKDLTLRGTISGVHTQFEIQNINHLHLNNIIIDSCNMTTNYALKLTKCFKYNIENCEFNNNHVKYALLSDENSGTYSNISNCYFISNNNIALKINKRDLNIANNFFWGNGGIAIEMDGSYTINEYSASKTNISNNTINLNGSGIQIDYGYYINIIDNNIHANDRFAIKLRGTKNFNISSNIFENNGGVTGDAQIIMETIDTANCHGNIITGNQFINKLGISPYAIEGDVNQDNNIIGNNSITPHYGGGIMSLAGNNIILPNINYPYLRIDNSNTATPLIYGDFTNDSLVINSKLKTQYFYQTQPTGSLTDGAPTAAEINAILGSAATAGAGFKVTVKDSDGTGLLYIIESDGTDWFYVEKEKASCESE